MVQYVTPGAWGAGLGRKLTAPEMDANIYEIVSAISAAVEHADALAIGISDFDLVGDQLTIILTDSSTRGPYTLPTVQFVDRGAWAPSTAYAINDTFSANGSLYRVLFAHTSAGSFNAGANDGHGHNYYSSMMTTTGNALPTGGAIGQFVVKSDTPNFAVTWGYGTLGKLEDVAFPSGMGAGWSLQFDGHEGYTFGPPPAATFSVEELSDAAVTSPSDGDLFAYSGGFWFNFPVSSIQLTLAQLRFGTKVALAATGAVSLDPSAAEVFTITPTGDCTISASSQISAAQIEIMVLTSGTSNFDLTFDPGSFAPSGVLSTGTADQKYWTVCFRSDGSLWVEKSRSGPY